MKRICTAYIVVSLLLSFLVTITGIHPPLRAPFTVVEIVVSTIEGAEPDGHQFGSDQHGGYIGYGPSAYAVGQHVVTLLVYNPLTNWDDDIIARYDIPILD